MLTYSGTNSAEANGSCGCASEALKMLLPKWRRLNPLATFANKGSAAGTWPPKH